MSVTLRRINAPSERAASGQVPESGGSSVATNRASRSRPAAASPSRLSRNNPSAATTSPPTARSTTAPLARKRRDASLTAEHAGVLHRGRVTEREAAFVRANLERANANRAREGQPPIDPADPKERQRYGL